MISSTQTASIESSGPKRADASAAARPAAGRSGAGHGESVPRRFLVVFDLIVQVGAFFAAGQVAPAVQELIAPHGALGLHWPAVLSVVQAGGRFPSAGELAWVPLIMAPATVLFLRALGGYARPVQEQSRTRVLVGAGLAPLLGLGFLTTILFALKSNRWSRLFVFTYAVLSAAGLASYRFGLRYYKHQRTLRGHYARNVLVVGDARAVEWVTGYAAATVSPNELQIVGALTTPEALWTGSTVSSGTVLPPVLGTVESLGRLLVNRPVHEVIVILSNGDSAWLRKLIDDCDYFRVTVRLVPEALLSWTPKDLRTLFNADPLRLPEIVLTPPNLDSDRLFIKRLIDVVVSGCLLVLLLPLMALIALAIKLTTPGLPILYRWRVIGLHGQPFVGYKFTTMAADADERRAGLQARNEMTGPVFKMKDDPRVTRLGRLLRKYSLNELPQLWSVLVGDMSLVGPRPAFQHELDRYELWHKRKLCVKPGITCLWQVSGRNRIEAFDEWVRLDLEYIQHWSLWLDFRILVRTVWAVMGGSGW